MEAEVRISPKKQVQETQRRPGRLEHNGSIGTRKEVREEAGPHHVWLVAYEKPGFY